MARSETGVTNIIDGVTTNTGGAYYVGDTGPFNALIVTNAGTVIDTSGYIGNAAVASNNSALVTGSGSLWTNAGALYVGYAGSANQLSILNSGLVVNVSGYLGYTNSALNNTALVTGAGSVWMNGKDLTIGYYGSGNQLTIADGGRVNGNNSYLGYQSISASNCVLVSGTGSVLYCDAGLQVGSDGVGNRLVITGGGCVDSLYGDIGRWDASSNNSVYVTGSGSVWSNRIDLRVGHVGPDNQFVVTNGGVVENGDDGLVGGREGADRNTALVTGSGSVWSNLGSLIVGYDGARSNQLIVADGGRVENNYAWIGWENSSGNNVLVTGSGTEWTTIGSVWIGQFANDNSLTVTNNGGISISEDLVIGPDGSRNRLTITDGAVVTNSMNGVIGGLAASRDNHVIVEGASSRWDIGNELMVGEDGAHNSLTIRDGAVVSSYAAEVGLWATATTNLLVVTGNGSQWNAARWNEIGEEGHGNIGRVEDGGQVNAGYSYVGWIGNNNTATITGTGSVWNVTTGEFDIGEAGTGNALIVTNGGRVISVSAGIGGVYGGVNQGIGCGNTGLVAGTGSRWDIGCVLYIGYYGSNNVLIVSDDAAVTASDIIIGRESPAADNRLVVNGGNLWVTNAAATGALDVRRGTLTLGRCTVVANQYKQSPDGTLAIQLGGSPSNGRIAVNGAAQLDGTLTVTNIGGFEPALSNAFTILTAGAVSGAFGATNLPTLDPAFDWSLTHSTTSVVLQVVSGTSPYALWSQSHISDPNHRATDQNPDSDPFNNWMEYVADTDPTNAESYFHIFAVSYLPPLRVHFLSSSNRLYTLDWVSNLVSGVWTNVPGQGPRTGAGGPDWMEDTNSAPAGFYRMKVGLP